VNPDPNIDYWDDEVLWPDGHYGPRFEYRGLELTPELLEKYKDSGWKGLSITERRKSDQH
jgi:hypothetical protein